MSSPPLILASASPRRQELLRAAGLTFQVVPAQVSEAHLEHLTARELCLANARRKAGVVASLHPASLVLGADTLVYLDHELYGKPADLAEAESMLARLQGRTHQVVTGVCLEHRASGWKRVFADITDVTFKPLALEEIRGYLVDIQPLDKAGAYAIQDQGDRIVASISGSYNNVVGLPIERVLEELAAWRETPAGRRPS